MRSAPLITLDRDTCVAIDELIDMFLDSHVPTEISQWEEEMSFVWMTMVPLVHLAFAAGKEYNCKVEMNGNNHGYQKNGLKSDELLSEETYSLEREQSPTTKIEVDEAGSVDLRNLQSNFPLLSSDTREETLEKLEDHDHFVSHNTPSDVSESMEIETSASEDKDYLMTGSKDQFTWPGSTSVQKLGMFSLVHMLSIKENQQLALSENLLPYLVCLSWHLKGHEKERLRTSLANVHNISAPPSLKVAAKSVLALFNGLDMVFNL